MHPDKKSMMKHIIIVVIGCLVQVTIHAQKVPALQGTVRTANEPVAGGRDHRGDRAHDDIRVARGISLWP